MSVLDSIIEGVREDLAARRMPLSKLHELMEQAPNVISPNFPKESMSIIAEVKRKSPSKGDLANIPEPAKLAMQYQEAGAAAVSVLTEKRRFNGSLEDFDEVRRDITLPMLRKDFMVDAYQIYEARAMGADCILLIVAALPLDVMQELEEMAHNLGMNVLVEVHNQEELDLALQLKTPLLGINNRNLKTFDVSLQTTFELIKNVSPDKIIVTESGIFTSSDVKLMQEHHVNTFLIGEAFMRESDPGHSLKTLFQF